MYIYTMLMTIAENHKGYGLPKSQPRFAIMRSCTVNRSNGLPRRTLTLSANNPC